MYTCAGAYPVLPLWGHLLPMNASEIEKIVCYQCHAVLDLGDNYCRYCGTPTSQTARSAEYRPLGASPPPLGSGASKIVILTLLFAVLGPLALPLLWRCRCFSPTWKWLLTLIVLGVTFALVGFAWYAIHSVVASFHEALHSRPGL